MKDTDKSKDIMYSRLKKVHGISYQSDEYYLDSRSYIFFSRLWEICETMKEWDALVEKYKVKFMQ